MLIHQWNNNCISRNYTTVLICFTLYRFNTKSQWKHWKVSRQDSLKKHSYWCVSICYHELHVYDKNDKRAFKNLCPIPLFLNNKICSHQKQDSKSLGRNLQTTQARYHLELTFYDFKGFHCGMFNELLESVLSTLSYWRLSSFFRFFYSLSCLIGFFFFKSQ